MIFNKLEIENTPILNIDLSDREKENVTVMSYRIDELSMQIYDYEKKMKMMEEHLKYITEEVIIIDLEFKIKIRKWKSYRNTSTKR